VSGGSFALENYEYSFQQDFNNDAIIGPATTPIESFGTTRLSQFGNTYVLSPVVASPGVQIKYNGAVVTAGFFGAWTPIGAEAISGGYEIAWKANGASQYSIWLADTNGNMTSNPTGIVAGTSSALTAYEPSFHQDLNGDTVIGSMDLANGDTAGGSLTLVGINTYGGGTTIVGGNLTLGNSGTITNDGSVGLAISDFTNGDPGSSVGLAVSDFTNGDTGGSMNLAVMGDFMASTFVPPPGQGGGSILSAASSQPDYLAKPAA